MQQNIHLEFSVILQICNILIFRNIQFYKECRSYKFCKMQISILLQFYCVKILAKLQNVNKAHKDANFCYSLSCRLITRDNL